MILAKIRPSEAPSILADSISESGTVTKNERNMNIPVAVLIEGMMIPANLLYNPVALITEKVGFMMTSVGSIVVAIMQTKKILSHLRSYLAKA